MTAGLLVDAGNPPSEMGVEVSLGGTKPNGPVALRATGSGARAARKAAHTSRRPA
ncbi:hypothetical protein AB0436_28915 [Streptomyces sp. NPDC051322]|uniref:hypothetical protein n=1 Tax=Streptomyces sp. NPDC051322 TaxID=3154645 RepID=UPI00344C5E0F